MKYLSQVGAHERLCQNTVSTRAIWGTHTCGRDFGRLLVKQWGEHVPMTIRCTNCAKCPLLTEGLRDHQVSSADLERILNSVPGVKLQ